MKHAKGAMLVAVVLAAPALIGCRMGGYPAEMKRLVLGPSRLDLTDRTFGASDPDHCRKGLIRLLKYPWGAREPLLGGYAMILAAPPQEPTVRGIALRALAQAEQRAVKYMPQVANCLEDESADVRWDAAVALDRIVGESAVEVLRHHALADPSSDVRIACARALRNYRRTDVAKTLVECMGDGDYAVCYTARASLVHIAGRDRGRRPKDWLPLTQKMPPLPPVAPWWDLLGLTTSDNRRLGE